MRATQVSGTLTLVGRTAGEHINITGSDATLTALFNGTGNTRTASAAVTGATRLVDLADANGNSLNLVNADSIAVTTMVGGTAPQSGSFVVTAGNTLTDWLADVNTDLGAVYTASVAATGALVIGGVAGAGLGGALSGFSFEVNSRTNFNRFFEAFGETQAAQSQSSDQSLSFQIGSNRGQTMSVGINEMSVRSLSLTGISVMTTTGAGVAIQTLDRAIESVSAERSKLGAVQNRLDHTINNLSTSAENLTAAESRIRDVDMAQEMMEFTKNNILSQAAQAMLAQANQLPQGVLQLLR